MPMMPMVVMVVAGVVSVTVPSPVQSLDSSEQPTERATDCHSDSILAIMRHFTEKDKPALSYFSRSTRFSPVAALRLVVLVVVDVVDVGDDIFFP